MLVVASQSMNYYLIKTLIFMKKNILSAALLSFVLTMASCGSHSSAFMQGQGTTAATTTPTATTTQSSDALQSGLSKLLGSLIGGSTVSQSDIVGTWNYKSADCVFETENFLMKAGGEMAAAKVEEKLNTTLAKFGVAAGKMSFTFNQDNTYSATIMGRAISGNYAYDAQTKKLTLTYLNGVGTVSPQVALNGATLSLLYDADKLLTFLKNVSAASTNTTLTTLSTMLASYDGMLIGMELQK